MEKPHSRTPRALAAAALVATTAFAQIAPPATEGASPSAELSIPQTVEAEPATHDPSPASPAPQEAAPAVEFAPEVASGGETGQPETLRFAELPNFHRVDEKLFRGGQPGKGGMARLKSLGVKTVLDLRYERGKGKIAAAEAKAEGLRYFQIPMYGLLRPTKAQISRALEVINDPDNGPVFVHCERGSDRTGVVVACYRVSRSKWTARQANDEAMGFGMYKFEVAKRSFVREFSAGGGG